VEGLTDGWTEAARSTCSAWGLITALWLRESSWGWGDSFLFLASSGPGAATGREILLLSSRDARDGGELVTRCTGCCIELADTMVPELVIPSRCAARVSFEAGMLDDLEEDILCAETFCVLSASRKGCNGGPLVRITSGSMTPKWGCSPCQLETVHRAQRQTAPLWVDDPLRLPLDEQLFDCLWDGVRSSVTRPRSWRLRHCRGAHPKVPSY
jgi:hypothetical protein